MSFLTWPFHFVSDFAGAGAAAAMYLAPLWAFGSITMLPARAWKVSGRSKWPWVLSSFVGLMYPFVGIPVALAHAISARGEVKKMAELGY